MPGPPPAGAPAAGDLAGGEAPAAGGFFGDAMGGSAAQALDPAPDLAMFQVTEQTRTYPCRQCGDQLVFDIASQKLACPSCGFSTEVDTSALKPPTEHDFASTMQAFRSLLQSVQPPQLEGEKEIVCQNCGGHTTFTGSLTAQRCPYCATPIQRDDVHDAPARLPVDGVLPFQVDPKRAREQIEKWINSRWFAPTEFKKYNEKGSFTSVYAAYFTYDADTSTWYEGKRGDHYTVTVGSGENQRTETRTRWSHASGTVTNAFDDLAVLANDGFEAKRVTALEPWPTQQARPFAPEFVAGHLCRTYDRDAEACLPEAQARMDDEIEDTIRRDIGGDVQQIDRKQVSFHSLGFKHLLLPIWLLTVIYAGRPFQVFINGVTGEVQGQRPWSKVKIAFAVAAALVVIVVLLIVFGGAKSNGSG